MKSFLLRYRYSLLLILIFVICEIIVSPYGNFPLNDDWSYAKSVLIFNKDGKIDIGDWPAMTLMTHILWGALFTKILGFSFSVLRLSTLISSIIGILVLNKLVVRISKSDLIGFVASLTLLFNPFYFSLTNTYMTDVNFNTLVVVCCYFAYDFFQTKNFLSFILVFIFSLLLVLLRQFGIILPVCFLFSCLFFK